MEEDFVVFKVTGIEEKWNNREEKLLYFLQSKICQVKGIFFSAESWIAHLFDPSCPGKYAYQYILY